MIAELARSRSGSATCAFPPGVQIRDSRRRQLPGAGRAVPRDRLAGRADVGAVAHRDRRSPPREGRPGRHRGALGARDSRQREGDRPRDQPPRAARRRRHSRGHQARPRVGPRQRGGAEADAVAGAAALLRAGPRRVPPAVAARARSPSACSPGAIRSPRSCWPRTATSCSSTPTARRIAGKAPVGRVLIDGTRTGEVGDEVLRDRRHLAEDGLVVPVVAINKQTGALEGVPEIITRGFVMENSQALLADGARLLTRGHRAGQRRGTDRPGADQGEAARRAAPLLPQAFGPAAVRAARHHGDLTREPIDRFAPRQRVRRRRAVRRRADLDHRARQLRAERPGVVLQHRRARRAGQFRRPRRRVPRRAVVPAVRLRVVPRSRRCWSSSAGTTSGAGRSTRAGTKATGAGAAVRAASARS